MAKQRLIKQPWVNHSLALLCVGLTLPITTAAVAQPSPPVTSSRNLRSAVEELLTATIALPNEADTVTTSTISQTGLTTPSLWWVQEQFGGALLNTWVANPGQDGTPRRVDLRVNRDVWNQYDYWDRYAFINQFGATARDFSYNTRIFTVQGEFLGAYACNFQPLATGDRAVATPMQAAAFTSDPAIASATDNPRITAVPDPADRSIDPQSWATQSRATQPTLTKSTVSPLSSSEFSPTAPTGESAQPEQAQGVPICQVILNATGLSTIGGMTPTDVFRSRGGGTGP